MALDSSTLAASYRLIAELLLHPDDRDKAFIDGYGERLQSASVEVGEPISRFLADPGAWSRNEYVQTIELSPPCPLYLGAYLFDEPTTCRDIGTSGRNAYMLELTAIYRHFGFDLSARELPDYLPIVIDFLWVSLEHRDRDRIGLRRRFLEHYVRPGLGPLHGVLTKYESPYALLVSALNAAVEQDVRRTGDAPAWKPPSEGAGARGRRLPVLPDMAHVTPRREETEL